MKAEVPKLSCNGLPVRNHPAANVPDNVSAFVAQCNLGKLHLKMLWQMLLQLTQCHLCRPSRNSAYIDQCPLQTSATACGKYTVLGAHDLHMLHFQQRRYTELPFLLLMDCSFSMYPVNRLFS